MRQKSWVLFALFAMITIPCLAAEQTVAERQVKEKPLPALIKEKIYVSSDYDYGWVHIDSRTGKWGLSTNTIAYSATDYLTPYLTVNAWDRLHDHNTAVGAGTYLKFKDLSFIRTEFAAGLDPTYLYQFQYLLEYNHKLVKDLFWFLGYHYLHYSDNDVFIAYPGLIYYFGNNYFTVSYNNSVTESRGDASWGVVKGNFALNDRISFWLGTAIGQRLYDIDLLSANKQYGYILFTGIDTKITKSLDLRFGFSYSHENPDFIKRSLEFGASYKF